MTVLYRYLRPEQYSFRRREIQTAPRGGVCFRIETDEGEQHFSYSICHPTEIFSKDVARRIVDGRAEHGFGFYIELQSTSLESICEAALRLASDWNSVASESPTARELYQSADLGVLAQRIQEIQRSHRVVRSLTSLDQEVLSALALKEKYASQNG